MNVVIIQSANNGFFPRFYKLLNAAIKKRGNNVFLLEPKNGANKRTVLDGQILFGSRLNWFIHSSLYRITGLQDIWSFFETFSMLTKLHKLKPDVIHLHVVNECVINFPLFSFFTRIFKIPVVWTMHDCRAFTGRCAYFDEISCERWLNGCGKCPQKELYSPTWIDNSALQWSIRKRFCSRLYSLHIVTPSSWLLNYVKKSFYKNIPCQVIYNGIDTTIFSLKQNDNWLDQYNVRGKLIILGVAGAWEKRKGFDFFVKLSQELPSPYQVVLVGNLPSKIDSIVNIPKTTDAALLASIYQYSTVFCNPTLADNFPTTNIESLAAGTPVVTYNTGGSPEALDESCGLVVEKGNYEDLKTAIIYIIDNIHSYSEDNCKKRSLLFTNQQYFKYVDLYNSLL